MFRFVTTLALLGCWLGLQDNRAAALQSRSTESAALFVQSDSDCPPVDEFVLASVNLTERERELVPDICWRPSQLPVLHANEVRNAIPPGVTCNQTTWCDSDGSCSTVCARGTVAIEPWFTNAIKTQMKLARRLPLCMYNMLGTHNSAITTADGYGNLDEFFEKYLQWIKWAGGTHIQTNNQWVSLTDQLNMGVRNVELDVHWVKGQLRIAHCGGSRIVIFDKLIDAINLVAKLVGAKIRWDSETIGCNPSLSSIPAGDQRTFRDALEEVAAWHSKPDNQQEFLMLYLDNQMDLKQWGLVPELIAEIEAVYPVDALFTPEDLKQLGGNWPTPEQLVQQGKRAMIISGADYGTDMATVIFARGVGTCNWWEPELYQVKGVPQCTVFDSKKSTEGPMMAGRLYRINTCELMYGPLNCDFVFHGVDGPLLNEESLPGMVECGLNMPCPDSLTPHRAASAIWSWAEGHPLNPSSAIGLEPVQPHSVWRRVMLSVYRWVGAWMGRENDEEQCASISAEDGRWHVTPCDTQLPTACKLVNGSTWMLQPGARGSCPDGYLPSLPIHPSDNLQLQLVLQQMSLTQSAWLPITGPNWDV